MNDRAEGFINYLIEQFKTDKGTRAFMRRADNPSMEYQAWEILARFGVNLEDETERKSYATVGAALARANPSSDGGLELGTALGTCGKDGKAGDPEKARLRRILACTDVLELCGVLRHILPLFVSRKVPISYTKLLKDILQFKYDPEKVKIKWAKMFFAVEQVEEAVS